MPDQQPPPPHNGQPPPPGAAQQLAMQEYILQQQQQQKQQQAAGYPPTAYTTMDPAAAAQWAQQPHAMHPMGYSAAAPAMAHLQPPPQANLKPLPQQQPSMVVDVQVQPPPPAPPQAAPQQPRQGHAPELRVEDALYYLDDVKREFKDRPLIYNEFLAIMKNFKSQEVDTPGVIRRVSRLFKGYNNLILGFNTFLPDDYKISLQDIERNNENEDTEVYFRDLVDDLRIKNKGMPQAQLEQMARATMREQGIEPPQAAHKATKPATRGSTAPARRSPTNNASASGGNGVEFDHAISYVTKIKRRFAGDPKTYHSFLEILHTYQKEQRGIKEVLEQVAHLFQDHPDLLKEFTFFLPDAVQEQAKERLHRAAAESEHRLAQRERDFRAGGSPRLVDMTAGGSTDPMRAYDSAEGPTYVYNSAVERQFFDVVREALTSYTRDGGQAWAEFIKCLDMYAQEILSRAEMLEFMEQILGKRNTRLFEEFKRILNAAGSPDGVLLPSEDSWYSVPLSEIDFSRCRRCTPSYRALPRDYPAPPCSDRNEEERKVLNDVWVSLPVGSEESYTFRHMRRNTYEETLFRVEDERFEIDMVIDSNAATLQRLKPVVEEIAQLSQEELGETGRGIGDGSGMGAMRFQYTFNESILGVIHNNVIRRIYGDSGQEMLDLMIENPTVTIPLVYDRLRQKDEEWRAVRNRLNKHWRELAEHNYYRSLDHRGLTWRTVDKRATSTRTLTLEIKDRAQNGGKESTEALKIKMDKLKEEHGTFFEVTMKEALSRDLDLTFLPKPDRRLFTPHLALEYENNSWAQRDAYRILAYALERGSISPVDKERCHKLWLEFLGPWFGLSIEWMQHPAVTFQERPSTSLNDDAPVVSEEEEEDDESMEVDIAGKVITEELGELESTDNGLPDHHPLPAGAHVSTPFGEGKILEFRHDDNVYVLKMLRFSATAILRPATVLCSVLPVEKSAHTRQLRAEDHTKLARPGDQLAFGNQSFYLFMRLHQILVKRLNTAKRLAYSVGNDKSLQTMVEQMTDPDPTSTGRRRYEAYLSLVYGVLESASEAGKYEDRVRSLLGHGGYELATMDKLVGHIWKHLQSMAQDETMWNLVQVYRRHVDSGSFKPEAFRREATFLAEGEAMYAFQYCPMQGQDQSVLYVEYLGVMDDSDEEETSEPASKKQKR